MANCNYCHYHNGYLIEQCEDCRNALISAGVEEDKRRPTLATVMAKLEEIERLLKKC